MNVNLAAKLSKTTIKYSDKIRITSITSEVSQQLFKKKKKKKKEEVEQAMKTHELEETIKQQVNRNYTDILVIGCKKSKKSRENIE